jgi:two-component system sensor histidine kinase DegS
MIVPLSTPGENAILSAFTSPCNYIIEEIVDQFPIDTPSLSIPTFFQLQEEERYRLARALMQGPGQILANTLVELDNSLPLIESNPIAAAAGLSALREEIRSSMAQLRTLVSELQPPLLAEMGLGLSLRQYVESFGARNEIQVNCVGCDSMRERLPITMETVIFRIVQEALANIIAHAGATSVNVHIGRVATQVWLEVRDNGRGFVPNEGAGVKRRQLGLVGMYDRAKLIGGQLQIYSEARRGTRVVLTVPYHLHEEESEASGGQNEDGREIQNGRKKIKSALSGEIGSG